MKKELHNTVFVGKKEEPEEDMKEEEKDKDSKKDSKVNGCSSNLE